MKKTLRAGLPLLGILLGLSGCGMVVLDPAGYVAAQQRDLLVISVVLMLLIILPVMAATAYFAWKYRHDNLEADYQPDWHHSTQLEVLIWSAPLLIIIALGAITWIGTHTLDPYRELTRIEHGKVIPQDTKGLNVEVVSLNWKWLFIYPDLGIATVNELAAPVDTPIDFDLTSSDIMNSFYIPALAGQIYTMAGMKTQLHAVINKTGTYKGFSANYSGAGFSGMNFAFHGMKEDAFKEWVRKVQAKGDRLSRKAYLSLRQPSEDVPVKYYSGVDKNLFHDIVNRCVEQSKVCMNAMKPGEAGPKETELGNDRESVGANHANGNPARRNEPSANEPEGSKSRSQSAVPNTLKQEKRDEGGSPGAHATREGDNGDGAGNASGSGANTNGGGAENGGTKEPAPTD
ncbi:ubiquinol oxidase subunit II [Pararhizobium mangrovi]|uniref:Ubiquinol oxidase polypeptide II n=1 Tax=Pararhizobium mangrovi TaxID=2590452 RepID=A0A506U0V0_9HYPH|nr:ubiquinol oxidase subunit II [Pararhizobium mangrovi]TPW26831.1 ubiquinol oxidase subunit II [Pararhizobium mangrovi]